jgi:hypothetical protein
LPEAQALTGRIEESFVRRLETLSGDARRLLLLAAAEPVGDSLLLLRACEWLGVTVSVVDAETDGLLAISERVTFRHPLVRSAVYRSATVQERRLVHLALAEATDRHVDPDRRAWHLATAAAGPDEEVALALERSAGHAQGRGGVAAAAAFLQRAVALTQDPEQRAERSLAAAQASFQAGAFDTALELLATAEDGPLDELQRARVDLLRGHVAFASGLGSEAPTLLLGAARRLEALDLNLARETYLTAWGAAVFAGPSGGGALREICRAVRALPPPSAAPRPLGVLLDGLALLTTEGHAAAAVAAQPHRRTSSTGMLVSNSAACCKVAAAAAWPSVVSRARPSSSTPRGRGAALRGGRARTARQISRRAPPPEGPAKTAAPQAVR